MDPTREAYWVRKLRPIRPGAEPVETQLTRRFYGMVVISALTALIGLILLAIFAAFARVDIGLRIVGLIFAPATLWFWLDYAVLRRRATAYLRERGESSSDDAPPG